MIPRSLRLILVLMLALFLVACQGLGGDRGDPSARATAEEPDLTEVPEDTDEPDDTDEPEDTEEPDDTDEPDDGDGEVSVFDLEVGMCFNIGGDGSSLETVPVVACDESHAYEVFALVEHEAGDDEDYPGDREMDDFAFEECEPEFEDYVGTPYEESIYSINYLTPSEDTWAAGDREVVCLVYDSEEEELSESVRGSEE